MVLEASQIPSRSSTVEGQEQVDQQRYRVGILDCSSCCNKKYHRLGGFNNQHLFLTFLEARKSKIKVRADSMFGESWLPVSYMTISHCVVT